MGGTLGTANPPTDRTPAMGGTLETANPPANPTPATGGIQSTADPTPPVVGPADSNIVSGTHAILSDDDHSRAAVLSYNTFDILCPPRPLKFGEFNPRPIVPSGVANLANAFLNNIFTPFRQEAMIPILLHPSELDPSCVNESSNLGLNAPPLKLSSKGIQLAALIAFGGNHRLHAVQRVMATLDKQMKDIADKIKALKRSQTKGKGRKSKSKKKAKANNKSDESTDDDDVDVSTNIDNLQTQSNLLNARKSYYCTWGVVVYNAGTSYHSFPLHA
jgi:hypothetical protein